MKKKNSFDELKINAGNEIATLVYLAAEKLSFESFRKMTIDQLLLLFQESMDIDGLWPDKICREINKEIRRRSFDFEEWKEFGGKINQFNVECISMFKTYIHVAKMTRMTMEQIIEIIDACDNKTLRSMIISRVIEKMYNKEIDFNQYCFFFKAVRGARYLSSEKRFELENKTLKQAKKLKPSLVQLVNFYKENHHIESAKGFALREMVKIVKQKP